MAVQPSTKQQLSLDPASEAGFVKFFDSLPKKPPTTIRFFDRNEYYTVHGQDAVFAATEVFNSHTVIRYLGGSRKLEGVVLNKSNFASFVRNLLLIKQYRVEIFKSNGKLASDWSLEYKATPGNLQQLEDVVFGDHVTFDCSTVLAIRLTVENGRRVVGVAFIESTGRRLGVCQFEDNDQFSNVESLIVQVSPKECVLCKDTTPEANKLRQVIIRANCCITDRKKSEFDSKNIVQDLSRLLKTSSSGLPEFDLQYSMCAMAALIKYLELFSDQSNFSSFSLETLDLCQYMRLDSAAFKALNIEPTLGEDRSMCIIGILNKCHTHQGQRLLNQWIKQPLIDSQRIEERLDIVEAFFEDTALRHTVREDHLKCFPDLYRVMKKLQRGKGALVDCVKIYQSLQRLPLLLAALDKYCGSHKTVLDEMFTKQVQELEQDFIKFQEMIETTIDLENVHNHEYLIKPSFDDSLTQLRYGIDEIEEKINILFRKTSSELSLEPGKTLKLDQNGQHGYYLRVTKKFEKSLRGQKKFYILETRNDGVRFTFSALRQLSEEYLELRKNYNEIQGNLVEEVLKIASGYTDPVLILNDVIAQLDTYTSLAHAASSAPVPYVRPGIAPRGQGDILLKGARHPCLEMQDNIAFIANDVTLLRDSECFQIITGPNMGGKSTYIRMIGVVVLMAQIGSFVPCSSASVSVVDCILARVGAGDSQLKGVSTFMSEMLETASILKSATKDSLIIIDELGRGTSTYDGFGLAWAISEYISTNICCFCLFATHFHELTSLADEVQSVSNLHVTASTDKNAFTLLYKVKSGVCDQSFGIHVAKLANFPLDVINMAREKAKELEIFHKIDDNDSIDEPSAKRQRLEIKEGEKIIQECLEAVKKLPYEEMEWSDLQKELSQLKQSALSKGNSYIEAIVSSASGH